MTNTEKYVVVTNKSAGLVIYNTSKVRREFYTQQSRRVPASELVELCQQPGGPELFYNYLYVNDPELVRECLGLKPEIEYWLKEEDIPGWLDTCSLDEFIDALNFAPEGTKDIIKKLAVEKNLNDYGKRQAMLEVLGFDITAAIAANMPDKDEAAPPQPVARRAAEKERKATIIIPTSN